MKIPSFISLAFVALSSVVLAQTPAPLTLERGVILALESNSDVKSAESALTLANRTLTARNADPTALITDLLQAKQGAELSQAQLISVRLDVTNETINEFLNLDESKDAIDVLEAQLKLVQRTLEITKARLQARTATPVDVQRAETDVAGVQQQLADTKAARPVIVARLARVLGLARGAEVSIAPVPAFAVRKLNVVELEANLEDRAPQLIQAVQAVEFAELNVKITDNDYTPAQQQREAASGLENARRALGTAKRKALNGFRDALRTVNAAAEGVSVAKQNLSVTTRNTKNDEERLKQGLISRIQLEATQLTEFQAKQSLARAENGYLRALAGLSLAAGLDVTGLVKGS
jgi:outer membrane protein